MNKKTWFFIIVGLVISLAGGFLLGKKFNRPPSAESLFIIQIDSLTEVNRILQDSLSNIRSDTKVITRDIIKYRTLYDTIRVSQNTNELIGNLKTIINTPIQ